MRFDVAPGTTLAFDLDRPEGSGLDSFLRLFDSDGNELAHNDDGAAPGEEIGPASYLEQLFPMGGTYYLGVSGSGNDVYDPTDSSGTSAGRTGWYDLAITVIQEPAPAPTKILRAALSDDGSEFEILLEAEPGQTYYLESSGDGRTWTEVDGSSRTASSELENFAVEIGDLTRRFYRAIRVP